MFALIIASMVFLAPVQGKPIMLASTLIDIGVSNAQGGSGTPPAGFLLLNTGDKVLLNTSDKVKLD